MRNRLKSPIWRFCRSLILVTLLFAPLTGIYALPATASHEAQTQAPDAPGDHLITDINLGPDTPNILHTNQHVDVNFHYKTNQAGGIRIFILPYTSGNPSPNLANSGSPLYPTSASGQGSAFFTITSGSVVVDQIRLWITNSDQSEMLFEAFLPVYYLFSDADHLVTHIDLTPDTPDVLQFNQHIDHTFNYITRQVGGVRIFVQPYRNGNLAPNSANSGSPLYQIGGGSGSGFFTILSGPVVVDQIQIQMWDATQANMLFEAYLPVYYRFRNQENMITHIEFRPDTPNIFQYGQDVTVSFQYTNNQEEGVRILARPFSGAHLSPNYGAEGSLLYPLGVGFGNNSFHLNSGPTVVDKVRIQMWNASQTTLLYEAFLPVHLFWAGAGPPPGPDMHLDAIEVTQAIQDLNNSVDLVAGKKTFVRVHASSPVNVADVYATLSGQRGFVSLTPLLSPGNPGADITVRTVPDRGQINDSFWFELPSGWTAAGNVTLTARLDPINAKNDLVLGNNIRTVTVNFKDTPPLRLRQMNVRYTSGATTYQAGNSHLSALESWLRRAYPIHNLQATRSTYIYPNAGLPNVNTLNSNLAFAKLVTMIFTSEDWRVVYYGVVDDGGGFMRGKALGIPSTVASGPSGTDSWGWDFDGSYNDWYGGHEIGHTRGRPHAEFCGAADGALYPYTGGRISPALSGNSAIYGFDITTRAIYSPSWKDVMTYCNNQWVSDFTYESIRSYLVGVGMLSPEPAQVTALEFLVLTGTADLDSNTASLDTVYLISQEATLPLPEPGDWTIALLGAANNVLATYPFAPDVLTDAEEDPGTPAVIAEAVPWVAGTVKVEIRYQGQVLASRNASANAPVVDLVTPANGSQLPAGPFQASWTGSDQDNDPLTYSLLYSNDGGSSWQTLATNLPGTQLELNTDQLPGGNGQLRLLASDGFLTGQDTNTGLGMPGHAPSVQILTPSDNQVFYPTQQVALQGSAYDLEDGMPGDQAFVWSSSIDGALGTGPSLNTSELTTGVHLVTLVVTDSDGMDSQAEITIVITEENAPEIINMELSPFGIGVVAVFGSPLVQEGLSVRSSSEAELNWTASEDIPWLSMDSSAGQTPSDLVLTIDPSGLIVGIYTGKITFNSPQASNSPMEVFVTLQVTGETIYLPLITKPQ